jgi:N-formylglutamate amidohydrolase
MPVQGPGQDDSPPVIPGLDGVRAFSLFGPDPSAIPVLISVPHAGRAYPEALLERLRHPGQAVLRLEDRLADRLAQAVADATGAMLLVAHAPRAMIDLNRAPDDVDWEMFGSAGGVGADNHHPGRRSRSGLGLIPRRLPDLGELWKGPHEKAELESRITGIHAPYHAALSATLAALRARWGAALLIDLHSMPSLPMRGGQPAAEFVVGDRFGSTCSGALVASAFAVLARGGRLAAHNRPYAGDYVLKRHAAPGSGLHAFQLEIDRRSYLDSRLTEQGDGFAGLVAQLVVLVNQLGDQVAAMGQAGVGPDWAEAAE